MKNKGERERTERGRTGRKVGKGEIFFFEKIRE